MSRKFSSCAMGRLSTEIAARTNPSHTQTSSNRSRGPCRMSHIHAGEPAENADTSFRIQILTHKAPPQVVDRDLEVEPASGKLESGGIEFRWTHVASGVVGSSYAFARYSEEVRIQLAV